MLLLLVGCGDPAEDRELVAALEAQLEPQVRRGDLSGAVVAGRGGRVIYARGFHLASAEARVPFTPETRLDVAELAETFTAAAVWLLAEEGRLDLDSPVRRYLPEFQRSEPTLRHLLSHSAGLSADDQGGNGEQEPEKQQSPGAAGWENDEGPEGPEDPPGALYQPTHRDYALLAEVVARVEERPLEAFLQERLLDRLGIRLSPSESDPAPALSYRRDGGWLEPDPLPEPSGFDGATGLRLSALDLYRWTSSFRADPGLRPETLERGSRPVRLAGATAGVDQLGWTAAADGRRHRFGRRGGLTSFAYRDGKRDLALVFVSNTAMPVGARPRLARALVRVLEGGSREPIVVPERAPLDAVALETLPGRYRLPLREGELELLRGDTGLVARLGGASYAVESAGEGRLRITGLDAWLAFSSPEGGRFGKLHWTSVFETTVGERVAAPAEEVP